MFINEIFKTSEKEKLEIIEKEIYKIKNQANIIHIGAKLEYLKRFVV